MKTFVLTLTALFAALSLSIAAPNTALDTTELKPFVLTIDVDRSDELVLEYQNAQKEVHITLMEREEGVIFVDRTKGASYSRHLPTSELAAGTYTLLIEYNGKPIKTHTFVIK